MKTKLLFSIYDDINDITIYQREFDNKDDLNFFIHQITLGDVSPGYQIKVERYYVCSDCQKNMSNQNTD